MGMMLRRYRATPDVDPRYDKEPRETMDERFQVPPEEPKDASRDAGEGELPKDSQEEAKPLRGEALDQALKDAGLSLSGTADEKRARLAEHQTDGLI